MLLHISQLLGGSWHQDGIILSRHIGGGHPALIKQRRRSPDGGIVLGDQTGESELREVPEWAAGDPLMEW
jgi:hypothetical protein